MLACIPSLAQTSVNADESPQSALVGVWGTEQNLGPLVRGRIVVDGRQAQWRAAIAGFNVPVQHTREAVTFSLPGGAGEFRGRLNASSNSVNGEWIQPPGLVNHNRYATPVHMALLSPGAWSGEVVPLEERASFYISIRSKTKDSLTAVIVNPEFNMFRRRSYDVVLNKFQITLTNPKRPDDRFTGTYDKASDRLFLPHGIGDCRVESDRAHLKAGEIHPHLLARLQHSHILILSAGIYNRILLVMSAKARAGLHILAEAVHIYLL